MSLIITPNSQQALSVQQQLSLLSLPAVKRIRLLKKLGQHERKLARKRIREQTTVEGKKFAARRDGKKAKMLKKLGKSLEPYVKNTNRLELKHKNALTGRIAALHQEGGKEKMTAARMKRIHGQPDYDAPCSRSQAKALIALGAQTRKAKGKGYKRATIKDLVTTLTNGQAGLALEHLRRGKPKKNWDIPVEPRPFLGDSADAVQAQLVKILNQISK